MSWTLANHKATALWDTTNVTVDTLDLRKGLRIDSGPWQGSAIGALPALMPTNSPASIETYVRGSDLVTTHPATTERPTRVQLYWRRWSEVPQNISAVFELIVSVQTHLLDSDPTVIIESRVPNSTNAFVIDEYAELMVGQQHLLVLPYPQDGTEFELTKDTADSIPILRHTLFRGRLEKGVILRGRLLFVWSNAGVDADALQECTDRFNFAEPVLTA